MKPIEDRESNRVFDDTLPDELPSDADPCRESGESHTFAYAGPMFSRPIDITVGETAHRDGFIYRDVLSPDT